MYTEVGRILSKQEAKHAFNVISVARENREMVELVQTFLNPTTNANIRICWERAKPGLGNWESLSVIYNSFDEKIHDEELFDNALEFAEAYKVK